MNILPRPEKHVDEHHEHHPFAAAPPPEAVDDATRESLDRLIAPIAIEFGARLLGNSEAGVVTFGQFVDVARDLIATEPEAAGIYLAALVAIDVHEVNREFEPTPPRPPSSN